MNTVNVFTITFDFSRSPIFIQHFVRKAIAVYGSVSLDQVAPISLRVAVLKRMRKFGAPGTPF